MTQVNLLPPELRERQRERRQTVAIAALGAAVVLVLLVLFALESLRVSSANRDLAAQQATNAGLQAEIDRLQQFGALQSKLQAAENLVDQALANRVAWSGVLHDLSLAIPSRMWLTDVTGVINAQTGTPPAGVPGTAQAAGLIGTIQFQADALDTQTIASWLVRLEQVRGFVNAWLSTATKTTIGSSTVVSFSSSVDLSTQAAAGPRGER